MSYLSLQRVLYVFYKRCKWNKNFVKKLSKGDYFGEQAILGEVNKTRNSNIEAITDVTLIS